VIEGVNVVIHAAIMALMKVHWTMIPFN